MNNLGELPNLYFVSRGELSPKGRGAKNLEMLPYPGFCLIPYSFPILCPSLCKLVFLGISFLLCIISFLPELWHNNWYLNGPKKQNFKLGNGLLTYLKSAGAK